MTTYLGRTCDPLYPTITHRPHTFAYRFVPYILFELPGNLLIARFRPRLWRKLNSPPMFFNLWGAKTVFSPVPGCVFLFGCITIAQGFVKNLSGLLATRFFLGLVEACVSPGCYYILAMHVPYFSYQKYSGPDLFDQVVQT